MSDIVPASLFDYESPGPVADAFIRSNAFVRGIRGPVGSGKSTAAIIAMFLTAMQQRAVGGKRRYRGLIIRNTYGELKSTTIKSFHMWFPNHLGRYKEDAPITHNFSVALPDGTVLDAEFVFLALDRPDHIKKLLSLEVTQAWINEAREVPKPILDALTVRVGRYPAMKDGGAVGAGVLLDTNSPDSDHWWARLADYMDEDMREQVRALEDELRSMNALADDQPLMQFFSQPSAETPDGKNNPYAENLKNLPPGYYVKAKVGKSEDWIKVYVRNEYGYVSDGKAVYPEYRDSLHIMDLRPIATLSIHIGMDFGLTPAAVFAQRSPMGQIRWLSECVATRLGAKNFAREVKAHLAEHYPNFPMGTITGDPAGDAESQVDENTVFKMLESEGLKALPAHTNDFSIRREAVAMPLGLIIDGQPGLVISPKCKVTRQGMAGKYCYKRIQVSGDERYHNKPHKNAYSHPCEAGQYLNLGMGVGKETVIRPGQSAARANRSAFADMDYNMHG